MALDRKFFAAAAFLSILTMGVLAASFWTDMSAAFGNAAVIECGKPVDPFSPAGWATLSFVSLLIGVAIASVGQIMSGLFSTPVYTNFVKGAVWGLLEGAVLLSLFTASFIGLQEFGVDNLDTARTYSTIIKNTAVFDFSLIVVANTAFSFFAKQNFQLRLPGFTSIMVGFQLAPMFRPAFDALGMMSQLIVVSVVEWSAHEFFLCFIKGTMLSLLLPAGIFLRIFGAKGAGNALIGIAIALYFVYPWLMVLIGQIVTNYFQSDIDESTPHIWGTCTDRPICCIGATSPQPSSTDEAFIPNGENWQTDTTDRISQTAVLEGEIHISFSEVSFGKTYCIYNTMLARSWGFVVDNLFGGDAMSNISTLLGLGLVASALDFMNVSFLFVALIPFAVGFAVSTTYEALFFVFIVSLVLPIFAIFITLTLAKEIAGALGTTIDLSALEKII